MSQPISTSTNINDLINKLQALLPPPPQRPPTPPPIIEAQPMKVNYAPATVNYSNELSERLFKLETAQLIAEKMDINNRLLKLETASKQPVPTGINPLQIASLTAATPRVSVPPPPATVRSRPPQLKGILKSTSDIGELKSIMIDKYLVIKADTPIHVGFNETFAIYLASETLNFTGYTKEHYPERFIGAVEVNGISDEEIEEALSSWIISKETLDTLIEVFKMFQDIAGKYYVIDLSDTTIITNDDCCHYILWVYHPNDIISQTLCVFGQCTSSTTAQKAYATSMQNLINTYNTNCVPQRIPYPLSDSESIVGLPLSNKSIVRIPRPQAPPVMSIPRPRSSALKEYFNEYPSQRFKLLFNNSDDGLRITLLNFRPIDDRVICEFFLQYVRFLLFRHPEQWEVDADMYRVDNLYLEKSRSTYQMWNDGMQSTVGKLHASMSPKSSGDPTTEPQQVLHMENFDNLEGNNNELSLVGFGGRPWKVILEERSPKMPHQHHNDEEPSQQDGPEHPRMKESELPELTIMLDPMRVMFEALKPLFIINRVPDLSNTEIINALSRWIMPVGVYHMTIPLMKCKNPQGILITSDGRQPIHYPNDDAAGEVFDDRI